MGENGPQVLLLSQRGIFRGALNVVESLEGLDPESDEYKQKFGQNLLNIYMLSTGLYFLAKKFREVIESRKLDLYHATSIFYTFTLTSVICAIENFGLERVVPGSFSGVERPTLFDFLGYSFSTLMTAEISPLVPVSGTAQIFGYIQLFGSLLIVILLVFIILTSSRERHSRDLDGVIRELGVASDKVGQMLEANYDLTLAAAEALLLKFNPYLAQWLLKLRHGEERAKEITASAEALGDEEHQ